jgi:hypothetical protein
MTGKGLPPSPSQKRRGDSPSDDPPSDLERLLDELEREERACGNEEGEDQGDHEASCSDERDGGEEAHDEGKGKPEGCCPDALWKWCRSVKDIQSRYGGLNISREGKLDRRQWPDMWKVCPHPSFETERTGANPAPHLYHHNYKVWFWDPELFWPT